MSGVVRFNGANGDGGNGGDEKNLRFMVLYIHLLSTIHYSQPLKPKA